jgi:hypothetical protein
MYIKNEDVVPFANKLISYYGVDGTAIAAFDSTKDAAWFLLFKGERDTVYALENPESITGDMVAFTKTCRDNMDLLPAKFVVLKFKIEACITAGSITDSLASFLISQMLDAIYNHDFDKLEFYYVTSKALIDNATNTAALIAVGFTAVMIGNIDTLFNNAKTASTNYNNSQTARVTLVPLNNTQTKKLKQMCSGLIKSGYTCFSDPLVPTKRNLYIGTNVLKTFRPTPAKEPVNKHFTAMLTRSIFTNIANRDFVQMTFSKGKGTMTVGRAMTKTGIPSATEVLPFGVRVSKKKADYAGTGEYFIVTYTGDDKGVLTTFVVKT